MRKLLLISGMIGLAALNSARADLSFNLTEDFSSGKVLGPGPFGTVNLHQDGTSVDVTVTLNSPFAFTGGGAGFALGFDLSGHPAASDVTISSIVFNTGTTDFTPGGLKDPPNNLHADGTGSWDYAVDYTGSGLSGTPPTSLSFIVTKTGGLTTADFVNNDSGLLFISDIGNTTTGLTGDVAVPEPTTMIAGALLLLPFGASTLRVMRNRKA